MDRRPGLWGIRVAALLIVVAGLPFIALAQAPDARPQFEVATIKSSAGGSRSSMGMGRSGDFEATNMSLKSLIAEAYHVKTFEVYGGPGWIGSDTFDVTAKPTVAPQPGATSKEAYTNVQLMLQTLLEERYALKVHRETKELPVYALVVAKNGLKVKPSDCQKQDSDNPSLSPDCGNTKVSRDGQNLVMTGAGITMTDLLRVLSRSLDRTVIDRSGYTQTFNATLEWMPDNMASASAPPGSDGAATSADATGASLFTALQEQLGLKFDTSKGPVDVLVVDHVEKPTPN